MSDTSSMFYGWEGWETTGDPRNFFQYDNPPFRTHSYSRPPGGRTLLKGYIRSAIPEKNGRARFHFQYNPNTLERNTTVNQDMLSLANQTAADIQLASLAGAGAGFSFSLILDRQDEVATSSYGNQGVHVTDEINPRLGVDVDIKILDLIAGIGNVQAAQDAIDNSGGTAWWNRLPKNDDRKTAEETVSGNQAFMASMLPVRVVFSKNMIVEGFIQTIVVTYTKFSINMVPTVATVQCSMQAFYIGAARGKTWWSDAVVNGDLTNALTAQQQGLFDLTTDFFNNNPGAVGGTTQGVTDLIKQNYGNNKGPAKVNKQGEAVVNASKKYK